MSYLNVKYHKFLTVPIVLAHTISMKNLGVDIIYLIYISKLEKGIKHNFYVANRSLFSLPCKLIYIIDKR